jgi:hypothetical protein
VAEVPFMIGVMCYLLAILLGVQRSGFWARPAAVND